MSYTVPTPAFPVHIEIKLKEENDDVRNSQATNEPNERELSNKPNKVR